MNTPPPPPPKKLEFTLSVSTEAQGRELEAACGEQTDLTPRELLDRAVDDLADKYRQKSGA